MRRNPLNAIMGGTSEYIAMSKVNRNTWYNNRCTLEGFMSRKPSTLLSITKRGKKISHPTTFFKDSKIKPSQ